MLSKTKSYEHTAPYYHNDTVYYKISKSECSDNLRSMETENRGQY